MIPIKLSIQGLYSYQDKQEIDFRPLTQSSVFGIFGKVGSGKTSLLEAISFALYGETERLNSRDNRQYNMMNLKSKYLLIDFEFQAGPDQQLYRFLYETKRHPKKHHEISPGERRMFIWQDNDWHPIGNEKEDVSVLSKQILGLDYDNFKRTIIIPQNQFREFLELSPRDRTEMMNRLFKLDQYDLAGRVGKLSKANDDQLAELRGLLAPLEAVTPEAIDQAKTDIEAFDKELKETDNQIGQLEPEEKRLTYLQNQTNALATAHQELRQWRDNEPHYQAVQQNIKLYEQCRLVFQADLANVDKLRGKHIELTRSAQSAQQQHDVLYTRMPMLQTAYDSAKTAYENRDQLQKHIDELDTVQTIRTLQDSVGRLTKNQLALGLQVKKQKDKVDHYKTERSQHQAIIDQRLGQGLNLERLYQVQSWFSSYKPLKKQADTLQTQIDDYDVTLEKTKQRKEKALEGFPPEWTTLTLKVLPEQIDVAIAQLETIQEERQAAHQQALIKFKLQEYADALTDGKPCPLCGSEHHPTQDNPHKNTSDSTNAYVVKTEGALKKVKERIKDMVSLRLKIEGLHKELLGVVDSGKKLINERGEVIRQLTALEDAFVWPEFTIEQESNVAGAIQQESQLQKQLQDAQKAVRELTSQIEETEKTLTKQAEELIGVNNDIAGLNGQIQSQVESLEYYLVGEVEQWDLRQIDELRGSLTQQYVQIKTTFDDAEKQQGEAGKRLSALEEQVQQFTKQVADLTDEITSLEKNITKNLTDNNLSREQVVQILRSNLDIEQEKERIKDYYDKLSGFQKLVSDLELELANQPFDPVLLATVESQLKTLRAQKDALNKEIGKAGNVLTTLERQWTDKQLHQKRHDDLDLRRQDLKKMDELFRAQGFVNYVSSVYLKNLCESANERFFKLTNNQLKLELDDKNNFLVRDYLNNGEVRSVKTLSGGQTFQAALSLALALSDNIQHLTKAKQNLFFLDEGFGTLDKDSLQTVFKTLKALRSENRVVGIISHVEELQLEVDNYIRTESTEDGSRIFRSWD